MFISATRDPRPYAWTDGKNMCKLAVVRNEYATTSWLTIEMIEIAIDASSHIEIRAIFFIRGREKERLSASSGPHSQQTHRRQVVTTSGGLLAWQSMHTHDVVLLENYKLIAKALKLSFQ